MHEAFAGRLADVHLLKNVTACGENCGWQMEKFPFSATKPFIF